MRCLCFPKRSKPIRDVRNRRYIILLMNLSRFIALRIYRSSDVGKQVSRPAVLIATIGVAIGLAVMIIAVSVIIGFKSEVRDKIIGFGSHIQISNSDAARSFETRPIAVTDSMLAALADNSGVKHVQRYSTKPGMIKTSDAFQGMVLKGIGPEYGSSFFRRHLIEGEFPQFSDSASTNRVVISKAIADKLKLKLGDKIDTYYIQDDVRARRLTIVGIYQTNFSEYDNLFLLTDLCLVNRLNKWRPDQVSGVELELYDYDKLEETTYRIADEVGRHPDPYGAEYCVLNVEQLNPQIFAWLGILDVNIWVILILMIGVAGFTMVSGLLIIIIERTSEIFGSEQPHYPQTVSLAGGIPHRKRNAVGQCNRTGFLFYPEVVRLVPSRPGNLLYGHRSRIFQSLAFLVAECRHAAGLNRYAVGTVLPHYTDSSGKFHALRVG